MSENRIGQQFGNYRLTHLLGEGGFAEVYLGEHIRLSSLVAVKLLRTKLVTHEQEEFLAEARMIASLDHPSIVHVIDCGVERGEPFLVMNYAAHGTLRQRYPKGTRMPSDMIQEYVLQLASALQYAHDRKLIHRDVKPENMLLGSNGELLLSDFGIALINSSSISQSAKAATGTVSYMAPEQVLGKPCVVSDQYALGIIVYEWLCGELPFRGSFSEIWAQHLYAPPPSLLAKVSSILPETEAVVMKALGKEPSERFPTVQDFAQALRNSFEQASPALSFLKTVNASSAEAVPHSSSDRVPVATVPTQRDLSVVRLGTVPVDWSKMTTLHTEKTEHDFGVRELAPVSIRLYALRTTALAHQSRRNLLISAAALIVLLLLPTIPVLAHYGIPSTLARIIGLTALQSNKPTPSFTQRPVPPSTRKPTPSPNVDFAPVVPQPTQPPSSAPTPLPIQQPIPLPDEGSAPVVPQPTQPPPSAPMPTHVTRTIGPTTDEPTFRRRIDGKKGKDQGMQGDEG